MGNRRSGILGDSESPWALTKRGEDRGPGGGEGECVRRAANSASYFFLNFFILFRPCDVARTRSVSAATSSPVIFPLATFLSGKLRSLGSFSYKHAALQAINHTPCMNRSPSAPAIFLINLLLYHDDE